MLEISYAMLIQFLPIYLCIENLNILLSLNFQFNFHYDSMPTSVELSI